MYCVQCGKDINDNAKFCPYCGAGQPQENDKTIGVAQESHEFLNKKKSTKNVFPVVFIVIACLVVFLFYLGPNFFGMQSVLPINSLDKTNDNAVTSIVDAQVDQGTVSDGNGNNEEDKTVTPATSPREKSEYSGHFVIPDSDIRYVDDSDLIGLSSWELFVARNEIYAWHGRGFKNEDLRTYFADQDWYVERYTPEEFDTMPSPLNKYEKANAIFILNFEKTIGSPYL